MTKSKKQIATEQIELLEKIQEANKMDKELQVRISAEIRMWATLLMV